MNDNLRTESSLAMLKVFVVDVDGTMTDSGIIYDETGNELKRFSTRDYVGIVAAHFINIKIIVLTGRECEATKRRLNELKVDYIFQNVKNKATFLQNFAKEKGLTKENIGYIGDDLNDYFAMHSAGFVACPADSCEEVKQISHYISSCAGGYGVVQDVMRHVLIELGEWDKFINEIILNGY